MGGNVRARYACQYVVLTSPRLKSSPLRRIHARLAARDLVERNVNLICAALMLGK